MVATDNILSLSDGMFGIFNWMVLLLFGKFY